MSKKKKSASRVLDQYAEAKKRARAMSRGGRKIIDKGVYRNTPAIITAGSSLPIMAAGMAVNEGRKALLDGKSAGDAALDAADAGVMTYAGGKLLEGAVELAAPVVKGVVQQTANWTGNGPKLVLGIGENGAKNLGEAAAKLPAAQVLPGETAGLHIVQAPLTTRGRVLTGQGTKLDNLVMKIKDAKAVKEGFQGNKVTMDPNKTVGDLIGGENGALYKKAYPVGSKAPVVQLDLTESGLPYMMIDGQPMLGARFIGAPGQVDRIVVANPVNGSTPEDVAGVLAHEIKHTLETREALIHGASKQLIPNRVSRNVVPQNIAPMTDEYAAAADTKLEVKGAADSFVKEMTSLKPELTAKSRHPVWAMEADKLYLSNGGENGARIFEGLQRTGTTDVEKFLSDPANRGTYTVTDNPWSVSGIKYRQAAVPPDQMDAKGGESGRGRESTAPTQEQLEEAVEFLETVMEIGACQNEWEQSCVKRIHDVIQKAVETKPMVEGEPPDAPVDEGSTEGDIGGGAVDDSGFADPEDPRVKKWNDREQKRHEALHEKELNDAWAEYRKNNPGGVAPGAIAFNPNNGNLAAAGGGGGGPLELGGGLSGGQVGASFEFTGDIGAIAKADAAAAKPEWHKIADDIVDKDSAGSIAKVGGKTLESNKTGTAYNSLLPGVGPTELKESWNKDKQH